MHTTIQVLQPAAPLCRTYMRRWGRHHRSRVWSSAGRTSSLLWVTYDDEDDSFCLPLQSIRAPFQIHFFSNSPAPQLQVNLNLNRDSSKIGSRPSTRLAARCSFGSVGRSYIRYSAAPSSAKCRFWSNGFRHSLTIPAMANVGRVRMQKGGYILYCWVGIELHRKWICNWLQLILRHV